MQHIKEALFFITLAWPITFVAVLLLSLPTFFSRKALRYRRRPRPPSDAESIQPYISPRWTLARVLLVSIAAPIGICFVLVFGVPIFLGMTFVAVCQAYRSRRHLAYRALRSRRRWLAYLRSHVLGFRLFIGVLARSRHVPLTRRV
jgi:hypothetical protein